MTMTAETTETMNVPTVTDVARTIASRSGKLPIDAAIRLACTNAVEDLKDLVEEWDEEWTPSGWKDAERAAGAFWAMRLAKLVSTPTAWIPQRVDDIVLDYCNEPDGPLYVCPRASLSPAEMETENRIVAHRIQGHASEIWAQALAVLAGAN